MTRPALRRPFRFALACLAVSAFATAGTAYAFPVGPHPPPTSLVYEYVNSTSGHFFYTLDPAEIAIVDSGAAGPGWTKTGLSFVAYPSIAQSGSASYPPCDRTFTPCVEISRFIGTPGVGPNAHFLTGNPREVAGLNQPGSGWTFEKIALASPVPDLATGQCAAGLTPVYRAYNNRAMFNDAGHRYMTSEVVRARMLAQGWIDEGAVLCSYGEARSSILLQSIEVGDKSGIQSQAACDAPTSVPRSCVAVTGVPVPTVAYSGGYGIGDEFNASTGIYYMGNAQVNANVGVTDASRAAAANGPFVQLSDWRIVFGIHLVARAAATADPFSSITPMVTFPVAAPAAGSADTRLFPFRAHNDTEYELQLAFTPGVHTLVVDQGSHAFSVSATEFRDTRSGGHFRQHVLAFGTVSEGDFTGRDTDGVIFVATSFRPQTPFGRALSGFTGHLPPNYAPLAPYLAPYLWSVNRTEFQATIDQARGLDPTLSTDPADYVIGSYGIRNQLFGSGNLGMFLYNASVSLLPR